MTAPTDTARQALAALRARGLLAPGLLVECPDGKRLRLAHVDWEGFRVWLWIPSPTAMGGLEVEAGYSAGGRRIIAALDAGALVDDAATRGVLLEACRKAWGDPFAYVEPRAAVAREHPPIAWYVWVAPDGPTWAAAEAATEHDALCAALLAAPVPT